LNEKRFPILSYMKNSLNACPGQGEKNIEPVRYEILNSMIRQMAENSINLRCPTLKEREIRFPQIELSLL